MKKIISNLRTARMAMMFILAMLTTQSVLAADKTALNAAVSEAEAYHSSIVESNPKLAEFLTMLINVCKTTQNDADATQEDVDFAVELANESVKQCKIAVAQANYAAAISDAEEYLATIQDKYPAQAEKLNNMINNAKGLTESTSLEVLDYLTQVVTEGTKQIKLEVAQADYAAAISQAEEYMASLQEKHPEQAKGLAAVIDFAKSIGSDATSAEALQTYTTALTDGIQQMQLEIAQADFAAAIADAEAYMASIQESNPSVAEAMLLFINAAKQVQTDDSYELADLEFATACMKELVVQAKEIVTTGVSTARAAVGMAGKLFDLQGRRVSQPSRTGVYINNGVKVVTK